jgi:PhnB protein
MSTSNHTPLVQPYLFFDGRCEEAIKFYVQALGAEVTMLVRFKDNPEPAGCGSAQSSEPAGCASVDPEKVMHADLRIGESHVMVSDGRCTGQPSFQGFALSLTAPTEAEADRRFAVLAKKGQVQMPLARTFFSPRFGMVTDRFGVTWMVIVPHEETRVKAG